MSADTENLNTSIWQIVSEEVINMIVYKQQIAPVLGSSFSVEICFLLTRMVTGITWKHNSIYTAANVLLRQGASVHHNLLIGGWWSVSGIGRTASVLWQTRSPDLTKVDVFCWGILKMKYNKYNLYFFKLLTGDHFEKFI